LAKLTIREANLQEQPTMQTPTPLLTTIAKTPESITQTKDPFDEIIEDWEKRNIVQTLTREEREKEYQMAVEKLHDFIEEEAMKEDYDTLQSLRRVRIEGSLHDRILTREERIEEMKEFYDSQKTNQSVF
jgi:hypothetical protein